MAAAPFCLGFVRHGARIVSFAGVATSIIVVATNIILSRQKFSRGKHTFVVTKDLFCRDKQVFVVTNTCLSSRTHKTFVATKMILEAVPPMIGLGMEGGCVAIRVGGSLHAAAGIGVISDLRVSG